MCEVITPRYGIPAPTPERELCPVTCPQKEGNFCEKIGDVLEKSGDDYLKACGPEIVKQKGTI